MKGYNVHQKKLIQKSLEFEILRIMAFIILMNIKITQSVFRFFL